MLPLAAAAALAWSITPNGPQARIAAAPTLVIDTSFGLDTLDPQRTFSFTSYIVDRAIYDTLFTYRKSDFAHPIPLLVRSWTSSGAKTLTLRLRRDVYFADGTPLTSADVVFSLRRLVNLKGNPAFLLAGVEATAKDKYTVVVRSSTPAAQLPSVLATPETGIVNSGLVRSHGGSDGVNAARTDKAERWLNSAASTGAGSGPYELQSYIPASQVTLRASRNYWGARKPAWGTIVIRNMSAAAQLLNIRRGPYQIAMDLSSDQAQTLEGRKNLHVSLQPSTATFYMFMHGDPQISSVTSNRRFRQAVRYALDYEGVLSAAGRGAIRAPGIVPSMILGALPQENAIKHNLTKAKAELAASGVGTRRVTLEYPSDQTINGVPFATLAQKVQASLQAAGFDIAIAGSPITTFKAKFRAGRVALGIWAWKPDYPDPADYLVFTPGQLVALRVGWTKGSDPAVEKLMAKALVATEPAARRSLYQQIQMGLNARSPFIPLIQPAQAFVSTTDLANAAFSGAYNVDVTQIVPK